MSLYKIANEYQGYFDAINGLEEVTQDDLDYLNNIGESLEDKAIAVASYIKNIEAEKDAINAARQGMAYREIKLDRKISSLMDYLKDSLEKCKIAEISKSPYFTIKIKKCPVSVSVTDETLLPADYLKVKEVTSVDKIKLGNDLKSGVEVKGAELKQNTRLEIK
jgi:hypothetical protein